MYPSSCLYTPAYSNSKVRNDPLDRQFMLFQLTIAIDLIITERSFIYVTFVISDSSPLPMSLFFFIYFTFIKACKFTNFDFSSAYQRQNLNQESTYLFLVCPRVVHELIDLRISLIKHSSFYDLRPKSLRGHSVLRRKRVLGD